MYELLAGAGLPLINAGDNEAAICQRCQKYGIDCIRKTIPRFRYGLESNKTPKFTFPESQVWMAPVKNCE